MKILFVSVALSDTGTATGIMIGNMIDVLHNQGHEVSGLGVKRSLYDPDVTQYRSSTIYHANYASNFRSGKKRGKDFLLLLSNRLLGHGKKVRRELYDNWQVNALIKKLTEIHAEEYDALIAVCASYDAIQAVQVFMEKTKCSAKCILIQYDPLAENSRMQHKGKDKLLAYEKALFSKCDAVFSTPFVLNGKDPQTIPANLIRAELPAIVPREAASVAHQEGTIMCVYAGDFYAGIREPDSMLSLFSSFQDDRIHLHVIGGTAMDTLQKYADGALKGKLFLHGRLPENICNQWLEKADILVSLGNKVNNQLPSKVLNYVCFGKPILNIFAIPDCPSISYLADYPLAIHADGTHALSDSEAAAIESKILAISGKRIDFETVREIYHTSEPDYVVSQLLNTITT